MKEFPPISFGLTLILAVSGGVAVANLYYNQPLLAQMAQQFGTTTQAIGLVATLTQLGYALGIFLFVPLGDIYDKKGLILVLIAIVVLALVGTATAQNLPWLYVASLATGLFAVVPQIILPPCRPSWPRTSNGDRLSAQSWVACYSGFFWPGPWRGSSGSG